MLSGFSLRDLQSARTICELAAGQVKSVAELQALIEAEIRDQDRRREPAQVPCPSCGRGVLVPGPTIGGLARRGCKSCYYSEVVE